MSNPKSKTALQILIEGKALIRDRKNFTQGAFARDKDNEIVSAYSDEAFCFCAMGAFHKSAHQTDINYHDLALTTLGNASLSIHGMVVPVVNDRFGHSAIIGVYDLAIRSLGGVP